MAKTKLEMIMAAFLENSAERDRFRHALMKRQGDSAHAIEGAPVHLWSRAHLGSIDPRRHTIEAAARDTLDAAPRRGTRFYLSEGAVVAHLRFPADAGTDFVAHIPDEALEAVLRRLLPEGERFDAEGRKLPLSGRKDGLRTARIALRGLFLSRKPEDMAKETGPSAGSIRKTYIELARRLDAQNADEAGRMMQSDLVRTLDRMAEAQTRRDRAELVTYHERFLAPWAQLRFLPDPHDPTRRIVPVVTMGPDGGRPLVALHAMMLPDLGEREARLFESYGIQAFFPLRHGVLDSHAPDLSPEAHLADALRGIDAVAASLGSERFHLAAMVTSSRIALKYAQAHPNHLSSLSFLAACVWDDRPDNGARAISKALIGGMRDAAFRWRPLTRFMIEDLFSPERFARFIKRHFEEAGPDANIIAVKPEYGRGWNGCAMRCARP